MIATKYGGVETKDIHKEEVVSTLLPKETADLLGLSPRETEVLAGVIHKDFGMHMEEPLLPTTFSEKVDVGRLDAHEVKNKSEQIKRSKRREKKIQKIPRKNKNST